MIFAERVSLVTGASQGIGEAIARNSPGRARRSSSSTSRRPSSRTSPRDRRRRRPGGGLEADVPELDQAAAVVARPSQDFGKIDHLVNNAGITRDNLFMRMKEEEWDAVIAVNLKGVFNFSKAVIRSMVQARYGRIVNLSSVVGLMGNAGQANYAASKAGLIGFSKSLAREVAARNITVNCVAPGYIATPMTAGLPETVKTAFLAVIPMQRFGEPADVARAVQFLCSDDAAYITGQVLHVNGGLYT